MRRVEWRTSCSSCIIIETRSVVLVLNTAINECPSDGSSLQSHWRHGSSIHMPHLFFFSFVFFVIPLLPILCTVSNILFSARRNKAHPQMRLVKSVKAFSSLPASKVLEETEEICMPRKGTPGRAFRASAWRKNEGATRSRVSGTSLQLRGAVALLGPGLNEALNSGSPVLTVLRPRSPVPIFIRIPRVASSSTFLSSSGLKTVAVWRSELTRIYSKVGWGHSN